jgi:phosphatidate cytidylyltransferase
MPAAVFGVAAGAPEAALAILALAAAAAVMHAKGLSRSNPLAFGIPYIGLAAVALVWLRQAPDSGRADVIVLLLLIWSTDIGAYLVGRAIGGPRLAPSISPGKTVSGAIGGLLAALLTGWIAAAWMGADGTPWRVLLLAGLVAVAGEAGDLFESLLKRGFGVKDSGRLIPGHGGLLDRLDAVLAAAPVVALLALLLGRGVFIWQ